jgi:hypothetical protein
VDYWRTSDRTFLGVLDGDSVVISTHLSTGRHYVHRNRKSIHTAFQGVLSLKEAAELLRADPAVVEEASRCGELPTVQMGESVCIDGPALLAQFSEPACEEPDHAS